MRVFRPLAALFLTLVILAIAGFAFIFHPKTPLPDVWNPSTPLDPRARITPLTRWKLRQTTRDPAACYAALGLGGAEFRREEDKVESDICGIPNRVIVTRLSTAQMAPLDTRCGTALRLLMWERHSLQPYAKSLLGEGVRRIGHFGSYSCRTIAGSSRMSQHATANAIDVAGFRLTDDTLITLQRHWKSSGTQAEFLRKVGRGACDWFALVLGPDYNAAHADHFHFDQGFWSRCR